MWQRIFTAFIMLVIFIPVIVLSGTVLFVIAGAVCSAVAVYEMLSCTGQKKNLFLSIPALVYAASGPLLARTRFSTSYGLFLTITVIFLFYLMFVHIFLTKKINTKDISVVFMTSVYITVAFTSIIKLRDIPDGGEYFYLFIIIGACITDIFAYFGGKFFGRHKLCPDVSPKKTIEGAVSGIIFCSIFFVLYSFLLSKITSLSPNYPVIFVMGAVISVISQFGDLAASAIKRDYGVKDYGSLFPGHGGILDRFDSIIAVSPFLFMIMGNPEFLNVFNTIM